MPVVDAPGSSCRRRPRGAASPAVGGRTWAAGCGLWRLWRAEGRGSRTWASRCLGLERFFLTIWSCAGLDGTLWVRSPLQPSLAAQTFLALGHGVQRGGCGAQLAAWRRELTGGLWHGELVCLGSKLANLCPEEKYKHTLFHKLTTHLAGIWNT